MKRTSGKVLTTWVKFATASSVLLTHINILEVPHELGTKIFDKSKVRHARILERSFFSPISEA